MAALLSTLAGVLYHERATIRRSWNMDCGDFAMISMWMACSWLCNSLIVSLALRRIGLPTVYGELVGLQIAAGLLNHLPMRVGTLFRASFLKRRYGLHYAHFASFFVMNSLLIIICATAMAQGAILLTYGMTNRSAVLLLLGLLVCTLLAALPLLCSFPKIDRHHAVFATWNKFVDGHAYFVSHRSLIAPLLLLHVASLLCAALRLLVSFEALGMGVPFGGCVLLGSTSILALYISLTPAGVGMIELLVGAVAALTVTPFTHAVIATTLVRAVAILWFILLGPVCLVWLRHRYRTRPAMEPHGDAGVPCSATEALGSVPSSQT